MAGVRLPIPHPGLRLLAGVAGGIAGGWLGDEQLPSSKEIGHWLLNKGREYSRTGFRRSG